MNMIPESVRRNKLRTTVIGVAVTMALGVGVYAALSFARTTIDGSATTGDFGVSFSNPSSDDSGTALDRQGSNGTPATYHLAATTVTQATDDTLTLQITNAYEGYAPAVQFSVQGDAQAMRLQSIKINPSAGFTWAVPSDVLAMCGTGGLTAPAGSAQPSGFRLIGTDGLLPGTNPVTITMEWVPASVYNPALCANS